MPPQTVQPQQKAFIYGLFCECEIIPTRSCQKYSKQFCLWDLAQIIWIAFIIQIV